ncbi:MAG: hypothetical protein JO065_18280, partial [Acidobacteria bacterium]|nr:hypothetical protein [Acidobacteriota bacterium]
MNPGEVTVTQAEQTQQPADTFPPSALVGVNQSVPFVPSKPKPGLFLKDNGRLFFIASGMIVVCLLLTVGGFSRRSPQQNATRKASNPTTPEVKDPVTASATATPILDWQGSSNP